MGLSDIERGPEMSALLLGTQAGNTVVLVLDLPAWRYRNYPPFADAEAGGAFQGHWVEPGIGFMLGGGYRLYAPGLLRFDRADLESPFGPGSINAFAFAGADPLNRTDPTGRMWAWLWVWRRPSRALRVPRIKATKVLTKPPTSSPRYKYTANSEFAQNATFTVPTIGEITRQAATYGYDMGYFDGFTDALRLKSPRRPRSASL